jgi:hypothetical protein
MKGECHGHIILDGYNSRHSLSMHKGQPNSNIIMERLKIYKDMGITFFRDGGDNLGVSLLAAKMAPAYGIDYRTPAYAICKFGSYGGFLSRSFSNISEYRNLVLQVLELGGDFIKIMASGILDFSQYGVVTHKAITEQELNDMINFAHSLGLAVMTHVNGAENVKAAITAGTDSVEHGFYINDECLSLMAKKKTIWVPTVTPIVNLIGKGLYPDSVLKRIAVEQLENVKKALEIGCIIAVGSDAGAHNVFHGKGITQEIRYLTPCFKSKNQMYEVLSEGERIISQRFKSPKLH